MRERRSTNILPTDKYYVFWIRHKSFMSNIQLNKLLHNGLALYDCVSTARKNRLTIVNQW